MRGSSNAPWCQEVRYSRQASTALIVDVDHHRALDRAVSQHLAQGRALAAANHQHRARLRVEDQGGVHQRLVVDELVQLGRLDLVVQEQRPSVADGVGDLELLEAVWRVCSTRVGFESGSLACPLGELHPQRQIVGPPTLKVYLPLMNRAKRLAAGIAETGCLARRGAVYTDAP